MKRSGTSFWPDETGATAALYALALPALVAVAGIAFDYARVASMDTELQNAADQAALAAATQLDRQVGSIVRARNAAATLIGNQTLFANDGDGTAVSDLTVRFYATQGQAEACGDAGVLADTAFAQAGFVCVQVNDRVANYALTPVVGALRGELGAQAVAGMGSALCRTPPLMMCNPDEPSNNSDIGLDFDANANVGKGFVAKKGAQSGAWSPGNYGWLETGLGPGAQNVRKSIGWGTVPGGCLAQNGVETIDTQPGNIANAPNAMNTRFDIYDNPGCEAGGACPPSINSRKDLVRAANADANQGCRIGNNGWDEVPAAQRYLPPSNAALPDTFTPTAMGHPRDICHATATDTCGGSVFGDGFWDRDAYFRSHYLRTAAGAGGAAGTRWSSADWRANTGLTLGGGARPSRPTRYEVYLWEIQNRGNTIDGVVILGPSPPGATGNTEVNHGTPVCGGLTGNGTGQIPSTSTADRRRISVAVVNCRANNVRGNMADVPVRRWMDVFLVQPSASRDRTDADEIYVEVIGETSAGSAGETAGSVIRRDMPYLIR